MFAKYKMTVRNELQKLRLRSMYNIYYFGCDARTTRNALQSISSGRAIDENGFGVAHAMISKRIVDMLGGNVAPPTLAMSRGDVTLCRSLRYRTHLGLVVAISIGGGGEFRDCLCGSSNVSVG